MATFTFTRNPDALTLTSVIFEPSAQARVNYTALQIESELKGNDAVIVANLAAAQLFDYLAQARVVSNPVESVAYEKKAIAARAFALPAKTGIALATPLELLHRFNPETIANLVAKGRSITGQSLIDYGNKFPPLSNDVVIAFDKIKTICNDSNRIILDKLILIKNLKNIKVDLIRQACDIANFYIYFEAELKDDSVVIRRYKAALKEIDDFIKAQNDKYLLDLQQTVPFIPKFYEQPATDRY